VGDPGADIRGRTGRVRSLAVGVTAVVLFAACAAGTRTAAPTAQPTAAPPTAAPGTATAPAATPAGKIAVSLITKTDSNPFFIAMAKGAKEAGAKLGVDITLAAGKISGDEATQITAIENAVSAGQKGILITPNGPGVNPAIKKARDAGLLVIALDTPPDPPDTVDITFATDNFLAGVLIGKWAAAQLDGKAATIAMIDDQADKITSVDVGRDHGFLTGMGIDVVDKTQNGKEAPTGKYTGGKGGDYKIVGHLASQGAEDGGQKAMETLLSKGDTINVVYTINEPTANGAYKALKAAGKEAGVLIVSVDGGCAGVKLVKDGVIGATSQQYPLKMASLGVQAIYDLATKGTKPQNSEGLTFFNTGVGLVTDKAVPGLDSIDTTKGTELCWG
jgi:fructose transport system substrate-binding protein